MPAEPLVAHPARPEATATTGRPRLTMLLRAAGQHGAMWLATGVLGPAVFLLSLVGLRLAAYRLVALWCRLLHLVTGARFRVEGLERVPPDGPYVVISNHSSHLDGPTMILALPHPVFFVIKKELTWLPVWGQAVSMLGFIAVDRGDSARARARLERAVAAVRAGRHVLVFPEGTRCPDDGMLPFKKGGFHLAVAAGAPILPIAVNRSRRLMPKGAPASLAGTVEILVGEPIPTAGLGPEQVDELLVRTRQAIVELRRRDPDFTG